MRYRDVLVLSGAAMLGLASIAQTSPSQPVPAQPSKVTGCVTAAKDVPGAYVFANDTMCAEIKGEFNTARALGHSVTFSGLLKPPGGGLPTLLTPLKMLSVGPACAATCSLQPPPTRGVHKSQEGSNGATNGALPQSQPNP